MNYDDEILMAYADGELDEARRAEIAAALEKDPELAQRVARQRALRAEVADAYSGVLTQPVPERLRAAARGAVEQKGGNVVRFPARATRPAPAPWRAREWAAMAASLVLGVMLSWRFLAPGGDIAGGEGSLMARGNLAKALDSQLASTQTSGERVAIGVSFKSTEGGYCRSFVIRATATAGLACKGEDGWRIPVTTSVALQGGDLRQATSSLPAAVAEAIDSRMSGDALDAAAEQQARDARWQ